VGGGHSSWSDAQRLENVVEFSMCPRGPNVKVSPLRLARVDARFDSDGRVAIGAFVLHRRRNHVGNAQLAFTGSRTALAGVLLPSDQARA